MPQPKNEIIKKIAKFARFCTNELMNLYYTVLIVMAVLAVFVFVMLFYFKAGYGYLSNGKWGPVLPNKVAWVLMEAPSFLFLLYYTLI